MWPRRAGKDLTLWNLVITQSQLRVGTYFYFFPSHKQAKRVLWDGMDDNGTRFLDYVPVGMVEEDGWNESELQIKCINGSIIQLLGADTIDTSALGTNCIGAVFSEYAVQKSTGYDYVRPILARNGGWCAFAYTPRGHNHGFDLYDRNKDNEAWCVSKLVAADLKGHHGEPLLPESIIEADRRSGMEESVVQQEYNTSFSGIQQGSYFADQCVTAMEEDRWGLYPYDPEYKVYTVSDLGVGLKFCTWFFQIKPAGVFWIDFNALESGAIPEFIKMTRDKRYLYAGHYAPHDVKQTSIATGQDRAAAARKLGLNFIRIPRMAVADRIDAGRRCFPTSFFHKPCVDHVVPVKSGWKALLNYRREYDEDKKEFRTDEVHDWASHGGSAFTYGALAIRKLQNISTDEQADTDFDEFVNAKQQDYDFDFDEFDNDAFAEGQEEDF